MSGVLFAVEGIGYSGKSTALRTLREQLDSEEFVFTREPGGTEYGQTLRAAMLSEKSKGLETDCVEEMLPMFADRLYHIRTLVTPALREGRHVITDRFFASTWGYQVYRRGSSDDENLFHHLKWRAIRRLPENTRIVWIVLDLPVEEALLRKAQEQNAPTDQFDEKDVSFWNRVADGIRFIVTMEDHFHAIDATLSPVEIVDRMKRIIAEETGQ